MKDRSYVFIIFIQVGQMIQAESDNTKREEYLKRLMSLPNQVRHTYFAIQFFWLSPSIIF